MTCDECGAHTRVVETHREAEKVHRLRQCPACRWMCNSIETYISEAYRPAHLGRTARAQAMADNRPHGPNA